MCLSFSWISYGLVMGYHRAHSLFNLKFSQVYFIRVVPCVCSRKISFVFQYISYTTANELRLSCISRDLLRDRSWLRSMFEVCQRPLSVCVYYKARHLRGLRTQSVCYSDWSSQTWMDGNQGTNVVLLWRVAMFWIRLGSSVRARWAMVPVGCQDTSTAAFANSFPFRIRPSLSFSAP